MGAGLTQTSAETQSKSALDPAALALLILLMREMIRVVVAHLVNLGSNGAWRMGRTLLLSVVIEVFRHFTAVWLLWVHG